MASKSALPKRPAQLTFDQLRAGIVRLKKVLEAVEHVEPASVTNQYDAPELDGLAARIDDALVQTFGADTLDYERYKHAREFDLGPYNYARKVQPQEFQASIARSKGSNIALLRQAIQSLEERLDEQTTQDQNKTSGQRPSSRKVFIVHGHDDGTREAVARFLERLKFEVVILHERPNKGRTIITKFREESEDIGFAVILMTPDDVGGKAPTLVGRQSSRARQNVVLEFGFFIGALGPTRVAAIVKGDLERPSDLDGVVYIPFDSGDGWKLALARELEAAELAVDWNLVMR